MSDHVTMGAGVHEEAALLALNNDNIEEAQVRARLAIAAALNRLAAAQEDKNQ